MATVDQEVKDAIADALREIQSARSAIEEAEYAIRDAQKAVDPAAAEDSLVADLLLLHKQLERDSVFAPRTPREFQLRLAEILLAAQVHEVVMAR